MRDEISFEKNDSLGNTKHYHAYSNPAIIIAFSVGAAIILHVTKAAPKAVILAIVLLGILAAIALSKNTEDSDSLKMIK
jgi:predicted esterase